MSMGFTLILFLCILLAIQELYNTGKFQWMSKDVDEDEHSIEMHLPYTAKIFSR